MRPSSLAILAVVIAAAGAAGVASLDGCALPAFTLAPDAGLDSGPPPPPPCGVSYPDPPAILDNGKDVGTLVFALRSIDMGDMGSTPGYDLDRTCTCAPDAGITCVGRSPQLSQYCDADGGVDNQAAKLFQLIQLPLGAGAFGSSYFSAKANEGAWSLLIRVDGYSGDADDPKVEVAIYPSPGRGAGSPPPKWDGSDAWPVMTSATTDGGVDSPAYISNGAYVAGNVLVATLPNTELLLSGGTDHIAVRVSAGVMTAKLTPIPQGKWKLTNGVLAARWPVSEVFRSFSTYRDGSGTPICTNSGIAYATAKTAICTDADILVDGTQPKSAPCDAISLGLGFTAEPAVLGSVTDADAGSDAATCPPGTDPADDSCN